MVGTSAKLGQHPLMVAAMLIAAATGMLSIASIPPASLGYNERIEVTAGLPVDLVMMEKQNDALVARVERIEAAVSRPSPTANPDIASVRSEIASLRAELRQARVRQQRIERVILSDPAKSIEVPMLRRDLDDAKAAQAKDVAYLTQAIDRSYNLSVGFLVAIVVALLMMALDGFFGSRRARTV